MGCAGSECPGGSPASTPRRRRPCAARARIPRHRLRGRRADRHLHRPRSGTPRPAPSLGLGGSRGSSRQCSRPAAGSARRSAAASAAQVLTPSPSASASTSSAAVGSPTVTVTWPAMHWSLPQAEAVALLDDRLRRLTPQTNALTIRQDHRVAAVEERSDATAKEVARLRNQLAETRRHLQVEGLRVEAWGFALVGVRSSSSSGAASPTVDAALPQRAPTSRRVGRTNCRGGLVPAEGLRPGQGAFAFATLPRAAPPNPPGRGGICQTPPVVTDAPILDRAVYSELEAARWLLGLPRTPPLNWLSGAQRRGGKVYAPIHPT